VSRRLRWAAMTCSRAVSCSRLVSRSVRWHSISPIADPAGRPRCQSMSQIWRSRPSSSAARPRSNWVNRSRSPWIQFSPPAGAGLGKSTLCVGRAEPSNSGSLRIRLTAANGANERKLAPSSAIGEIFATIAFAWMFPVLWRSGTSLRAVMCGHRWRPVSRESISASCTMRPGWKFVAREGDLRQETRD